MGVVIAGHGSRVPDAVLEFQTLAALFGAVQKEVVEYGFLEFERPSIEEAVDRAIARGAEMVFVLPAMLTAAHHVKTDIPNLIQKAKQKHPLVPIYYGRHIDLHPTILELCKKQVQQALLECSNMNQNDTLLMVVGRGSSDLSANKDAVVVTCLLMETFHFAEARYCYTSVAKPLFKDALAQANRPVLIFPYLLFRGVLMGKIEEDMRRFHEHNPDTLVKLAPPLGPHPWVVEALRDRYDEAVLCANLSE